MGVDIFGAIGPARGIVAAIIMPSVNTEAMNEHLKEVSCQMATGAHALPVCDDAGWRQPGERPIVPENISLLRLPPCAPELNPMENVGDYLRGNKSSSLICDTYEAMRDARKEACNFTANDPGGIASIGTRRWACVMPLALSVYYNGAVDTYVKKYQGSVKRFLVFFYPKTDLSVAMSDCGAIPKANIKQLTIAMATRDEIEMLAFADGFGAANGRSDITMMMFR